MSKAACSSVQISLRRRAGKYGDTDPCPCHAQRDRHAVCFHRDGYLTSLAAHRALEKDPDAAISSGDDVADAQYRPVVVRDVLHGEKCAEIIRKMVLGSTLRSWAAREFQMPRERQKGTALPKCRSRRHGEALTPSVETAADRALNEKVPL